MLWPCVYIHTHTHTPSKQHFLSFVCCYFSELKSRQWSTLMLIKAATWDLVEGLTCLGTCHPVQSCVDLCQWWWREWTCFTPYIRRHVVWVDFSWMLHGFLSDTAQEELWSWELIWSFQFWVLIFLAGGVGPGFSGSKPQLIFVSSSCLTNTWPPQMPVPTCVLLP